jgi:hypothetical protein
VILVNMGQKRMEETYKRIFVREQRRIEEDRYHLGLESGVNITTASTCQILWHATCRNNNASCAPSPAGTDLQVKRMLDGRAYARKRNMFSRHLV